MTDKVVINEEDLLIDETRDNTVVELRGQHKNLVTDRYVFFGIDDTERHHIEVNGVDVDEIETFIKTLQEIVRQNYNQLV